MAKPTNRKQFKEYCLRRIGWPVIDINVDDDQVEDRIDDALSFFNDYHFDGTEKIFMKHKITADDINRRWIYAPDAVTFITGVLRELTDKSSSLAIKKLIGNSAHFGRESGLFFNASGNKDSGCENATTLRKWKTYC